MRSAPRLPAGALALALAGLSACGGTAESARRDTPLAPGYGPIETRLLDGDLVNFHVEMTGARTVDDVEDYARCAAAQYALIRGYGFARHVRTTVYKQGGVWRGDAVYTVSPALPQGFRTIDAEVVVADCAENGIPTV